MDIKTLSLVSLLCAIVLPVQGAESYSVSSKNDSTVNTTTILASALISPGRYSSSILPSFNRDMAERLEKYIAEIPGVINVNALIQDSTIHFTVEKDARVRLSDIQKRVIQAESGAVMSNPMLEPPLVPSAGH